MSDNVTKAPKAGPLKLSLLTSLLVLVVWGGSQLCVRCTHNINAEYQNDFWAMVAGEVQGYETRDRLASNLHAYFSGDPSCNFADSYFSTKAYREVDLSRWFDTTSGTGWMNPDRLLEVRAYQRGEIRDYIQYGTAEWRQSQVCRIWQMVDGSIPVQGSDGLKEFVADLRRPDKVWKLRPRSTLPDESYLSEYNPWNFGYIVDNNLAVNPKLIAKARLAYTNGSISVKEPPYPATTWQVILPYGLRPSLLWALIWGWILSLGYYVMPYRHCPRMRITRAKGLLVALQGGFLYERRHPFRKERAKIFRALRLLGRLGDENTQALREKAEQLLAATVTLAMMSPSRRVIREQKVLDTAESLLNSVASRIDAEVELDQRVKGEDEVEQRLYI